MTFQLSKQSGPKIPSHMHVVMPWEFKGLVRDTSSSLPLIFLKSQKWNVDLMGSTEHPKPLEQDETWTGPSKAYTVIYGYSFFVYE